MGSLFLTWIVALALVAGLATAAERCWRAVHYRDGAAARRRFVRWLGLGLCFPLVWWFAWNLVALNLPRAPVPPLLSLGTLPAGIANDRAALVWLHASALTLFLGCAWGTLTFLWLIPTAFLRIREVASFRAGATSIMVVGLLLVAWPAWRGWITGVMPLLLFWSWVLLQSALVYDVREEPTYGAAISHLNFGRVEAAEEAVIEQLQKKEDDYEGWMMLARLYAEHFQEIEEAARAVRELCDQPGATGDQISNALHRLADWQLRFADDPVAARRTLAEIAERLPGSVFATQAESRLHRLPLNRDEAAEQRKGKTLRLPALTEGFLVRTAPVLGAEERNLLRGQVARLTERLEVYPEQTAARERLARVLVEGLGELESGIRQVRLLLDGADPATPRRAEWLGLLARWQLHCRADERGARELLRQIVKEHPDSSQAFAARRQLDLMDQAARTASAPPTPRIVVKL